MAVTVHLKKDGKPVCMILDIVEVAMAHSGVNLVAAFAKIFHEFGIADKVSNVQYLFKVYMVLKRYSPICSF